MKRLINGYGLIHRNMNVMTNYRNIRPERALDDLIENSIGDFSRKIRVESAFVTIERSAVDHPPILARIFIRTPGPDIVVEARDYTSQAAYLKAFRLADERVQIKSHRSKSRPQPPVRRMSPPPNHRL